MMFAPSFSVAVLGFGPWWSSAMSSDLGVRCAVIAGVGVVVLAASLRAGWTLRKIRGSSCGPKPARQSVAARLRGEGGTATVEFVLVFVPAVVVAMTLLQTVLVFSGNLFVHYAAFVATRSAIVEAPRGDRNGGGGLSSSGDPAYDRVERAAAFAVAPVSGRLSAAGGGDPVAFEAGLSAFFRDAGQTPPPWVSGLAGERLAYAQRHTEIGLYVTRVTEGGGAELDRVSPPPFGGSADGDDNVTVGFGPKDPVTIGVSHKLHLSIPWVSGWFSDGTHETLGGRTAYSVVSATSTMTLEGYDVNLPELPVVEREQ